MLHDSRGKYSIKQKHWGWGPGAGETAECTRAPPSFRGAPYYNPYFSPPGPRWTPSAFPGGHFRSRGGTPRSVRDDFGSQNPDLGATWDPKIRYREFPNSFYGVLDSIFRISSGTMRTQCTNYDDRKFTPRCVHKMHDFSSGSAAEGAALSNPPTPRYEGRGVWVNKETRVRGEIV